MNKSIREQFNIDFRPKSYWGELDNILNNIKGQWRREQIKNSLLNNEFIPNEILQDEVSDKVRDLIGRFHPSYMGGEYLPNYKPFEVEIARVVFRSVTQDVMSIRAKLGKSRIYYRIVDEYEDMSWISTRKSSYKPLTFLQLIKLLLTTFVEGEDYPHKMMVDGSFFCNYLWEWEGIEENGGFMRVESKFYPELNKYFIHLEENWMKFCNEDYKTDRNFDKYKDYEIFRIASGELLEL